MWDDGWRGVAASAGCGSGSTGRVGVGGRDGIGVGRAVGWGSVDGGNSRT